MKQAKLAKTLVNAGLVEKDEYKEMRQRGEISMNGAPVEAGLRVTAGDVVEVKGQAYRIEDGCGEDRLQALLPEPHTRRITAPVRVHCGLHKCLTEYTKKIYTKTCDHFLTGKGSFRHFYHRTEPFYRDCGGYKICSLSGQLMDLSLFDDIKVVRLVRDPRDLVVSSYFYHKRRAEHWCAYKNPTDMDWMIVNGHVPSGLPEHVSIAEFLNDVPVEEGIAAEVEFRKYHFESMRDWPEDERVLVVRYEDFLGNEAETMREIFKFWDFGMISSTLAGHFAEKFKAAKRSSDTVHIRDPSSAQWKKYFTPELQQAFAAEYGDVLDRYGYEA